uniref:Ribosomal RNA methyltransferase FtsJ domain-containing protein n=1 Tax=viral metagenome TaxID=1070528 RepID=A0A6C0ERW9_9ZZZZ
MSYYILPKNNNTILINPTSSEDPINVYMSNTLLNYYNEIFYHVNNAIMEIDSSYNSSYNSDDLFKIINPYEYIFSTVPGSKFSVSKLKLQTNLFYDFLEIMSTMNILDYFKDRSVNFLNICSNFNDTEYCLEMLREKNNDKIYSFNKINDVNLILKEDPFDFIFFDSFDDTCRNNNNNYFINLIKIIMIIFKQQKEKGICIVKINHIFYKPVVDIIYLLSSLFEKIYVIKPNTSNITKFDKYIVCKGFQKNNVNLYEENFLKLYDLLINLNNKNIKSLFEYDIPYYFSNKIDELNSIIGQQQLESIDQIISLLKNKNKQEKIENIIKLNIQKCVLWCDKFKIPCNKFTEKINIFLPNIKDLEISEVIINANES